MSLWAQGTQSIKLNEKREEGMRGEREKMIWSGWRLS